MILDQFCLLTFAAFLRFDELARLLVADLSFRENYLEIIIKSAKNDQLHDGKSVVLSFIRYESVRYLENLIVWTSPGVMFKKGVQLARGFSSVSCERFSRRFFHPAVFTALSLPVGASVLIISLR